MAERVVVSESSVPSPANEGASASNAPATDSVNYSEESEIEVTMNSESESELDDISTGDDDDEEQETDLCKALEAMRTREEVSSVLRHPVPSARQIVADAEGILNTFHGDITRQQAARVQNSGAPTSTLVDLMANMTQEMRQYQEESNIGPALHAARQVAYWSSVFVSMVSNEDTVPASHHATGAVPSLSANVPVTSSFPGTSVTATATITIPHTTPNVPVTSSFPGTSVTTTATTTFPHTTPNVPVTSSFPGTSVTTTTTTTTTTTFPHTTPNLPVTSSFPGTGLTTEATTTITHTTPNVPVTSSIPGTCLTTCATATIPCFISSHISTLSFPTTATAPVISYNQAATAIPTVPLVSSPFATPSIFTTTFQSGHHPAASVSNNQPTSSLPVTNQGNPLSSTLPSSDPATILIYREYGSGTLPEWLDSLTIPRNVESLHQIKEIWENGAINCPPLCKWTKVMRNHRAPNAGKNSSLFSQRKFMYTIFQNNNFDENAIFTKYNEVKPGKLYKILNAKKK